MPVYRVELDDGRMFDIDAESPEAVNSAVAQLMAQQQPETRQQAAPPKDDSALRAVGLGVLEPLDNLSQRLLRTDVGQAINRAGVSIGLPDSNELQRTREAARTNNTREGFRAVGNVIGTLPTMALPGGPIVQGAATGAALSDERTLGGVAEDAAIGGAAGKAGELVTRGVAGVVAPQVNRAMRMLNDAGVPLTLGQMASQGRSFAARAVKGIEDRAEGLPIIGDVIHGARMRGVEAYNRAVLRRALGRAGLNLPDDVPVGGEGIKYVADQLSAQYQQVLPRLSVRPDAQFSADLLSASQQLQVVPTEIQTQFQSVLRAAFQNRGNSPTLGGNSLKQAEEILNDFASRYRSAADPNQRILAEAVGTVRDGLRAAVARQNGQAGAHLQRINRAWRELTIAERAAGTQGNTTGVFSPKQYAAAARNADTTARHRATTHQTAPNQRMTNTAADTLSNRVPDSGTAGRAVVGGALLGAVGMEPTSALGLAALATPYTAVGQNAANWLYFATRPALVQRAGELLRRSAPVAGTASAVGTAQGRTDLR